MIPAGAPSACDAPATKGWKSSPTAVSPTAATASRQVDRSTAAVVITGRAAAQPRRSAIRCRPRIGAIIGAGPALAATSKMEGFPRPNGFPQMAAIVSPESPPVQRQGARAGGSASPAAQRSASLMANAIRALSMDAVQQANSGHPGAPMGMAEIAVALWGRHLRHNPANPRWPGRDRFVLSNGHGSMLLYSLLHLTGYDLALSELRNFRQLHSKTPGHPEFAITPGVETTTGPLGQGLTNAVGMALAEKLLAAEFNRDGHRIVDHHTYVFFGDGCLMEGISHEACALAGAWRLDKLIAVYDDNGISIDGAVQPWFIDDTPKRFEAYGWHVIAGVDGHDVDAVDAAIATARAHTGRPTLICAKTTIGKGAPTRAGTAKAHGEALGVDEVKATREALGWPHAPFVLPDEVYAAWDGSESGTAAESEWRGRFDAYASAFPDLAAEYTRRMAGDLPARWRGDRQRDRRCGARQGRDRRQPQGEPDRPRGVHEGAARAARRQRRPDRLQLHQHLAHAAAALCQRRHHHAGHRGPARPPHQLRRSRVRHGGDHERHRPARRLHPVRRHLPHLQRLQQERDPHGGADEAARRPRLHARLDRPRRGRADAPVDRARGVAAPDSEPRRLAAVRHARDARRLGGGDREPRSADRAAAVAPQPAVRAQARVRRRRARSRPRRDRERAPTCSPSRPRSACAATRAR